MDFEFPESMNALTRKIKGPLYYFPDSVAATQCCGLIGDGRLELNSPGPTRIPRAELPKVNCGGVVKAGRSNQRSITRPY